MKLLARLSSEAGETLAELLVTIAILGVAIVAIVGGLGDAILASTVHRSHATADAAARSAAEKLKNRDIATMPWNSSGTYSISGATITAQCLKDTDAIPPTFDTCPAGDLGLQKLTVAVSGPKGVTETFEILKRRT
jgi:hypothetical protein